MWAGGQQQARPSRHACSAAWGRFSSELWPPQRWPVPRPGVGPFFVVTAELSGDRSGLGARVTPPVSTAEPVRVFSQTWRPPSLGPADRRGAGWRRGQLPESGELRAGWAQGAVTRPPPRPSASSWGVWGRVVSPASTPRDELSCVRAAPEGSPAGSSLGVTLERAKAPSCVREDLPRGGRAHV